MTYKRSLFLLALLAAFPAMSTDMYLPALPLLQVQWGVDLETVNLTLVLFFAFFSVSLLVYGPISDHYGRRPLLMIGIGLYIAASIGCGLAAQVHQLILFRILQAIGAAAASALSMAIAKDQFETKLRQQVLAHLGVIVALAPMLAPMFGGWVLRQFSWPWIFFTQATWGVIAWIGVWSMPEPLQHKAPLNLTRFFSRYLHLSMNKRYMTLNFTMALSLCPLFAFIAGSPAIYMSHFNVSTQAFGIFFGSNALAMMIGAYTCSRLTRRISGWPLLNAGFGGMTAGGLALWYWGGKGPVAFAAAMFIITFCIGMTRPLSNNLVLEQIDQDVGAAASLLIFLYFVIGAGSMALISLHWQHRMRVIALMAVVGGVLMLAALHWMNRHWTQSLASLR